MKKQSYFIKFALSILCCVLLNSFIFSDYELSFKESIRIFIYFFDFTACFICCVLFYANKEYMQSITEIIKIYIGGCFVLGSLFIIHIEKIFKGYQGDFQLDQTGIYIVKATIVLSIFSFLYVLKAIDFIRFLRKIKIFIKIFIKSYRNKSKI